MVLILLISFQLGWFLMVQLVMIMGFDIINIVPIRNNIYDILIVLVIRF
jgi:hypothetical protein